MGEATEHLINLAEDSDNAPGFYSGEADAQQDSVP